jgi:hypothetical protein
LLVTRLLGGPFDSENASSTFLRKVGELLPDYTASHTTWQYSVVPTGLFTHSQGLYSGPDPKAVHIPTLFLKIHLTVFSYISTQINVVVSSLQFFQLEFCMHLSCNKMFSVPECKVLICCFSIDIVSHGGKNHYVIFLTPIIIFVLKSIIFWDMTPYSPLSVNQRSACLLFPCWTYFFGPEDGGDMFLRNVSWHSTNYTASYPRIWYHSQPPLWKPQILYICPG